jgi:DNA polymerase-3 subunit delta
MPRANVFFFTGEHAYALHEELVRWKKQFAEKHGEENLLLLEGKKISKNDLIDAVSVLPFLAEKRLIVIDGVPSLEKGDLFLVLDACHEQSVLVICDGVPDKRLSTVKLLMQEATVKSFPKPSERDLIALMTAKAQSSGRSVHPDACRALMENVGDDPWMLATEVERLALLGDITRAMVETHTIPSGERVIWGFTNLLGAGKSKEAVAYLREQLSRGEDSIGLWAILIDMIRKLVQVWACRKSGIGANAIASELDLSPFVVRGVLPLAESLDETAIRTLLFFATENDIALKTGGLRATAESPEEVICILERAALLCGHA